MERQAVLKSPSNAHNSFRMKSCSRHFQMESQNGCGHSIFLLEVGPSTLSSNFESMKKHLSTSMSAPEFKIPSNFATTNFPIP